MYRSNEASGIFVLLFKVKGGMSSFVGTNRKRWQVSESEDVRFAGKDEMEEDEGCM